MTFDNRDSSMLCLHLLLSTSYVQGGCFTNERSRKKNCTNCTKFSACLSTCISMAFASARFWNPISLSASVPCRLSSIYTNLPTSTAMRRWRTSSSRPIWRSRWKRSRRSAITSLTWRGTDRAWASSCTTNTTCRAEQVVRAHDFANSAQNRTYLHLCRNSFLFRCCFLLLYWWKFLKFANKSIKTKILLFCLAAFSNCHFDYDLLFLHAS